MVLRLATPAPGNFAGGSYGNPQVTVVLAITILVSTGRRIRSARWRVRLSGQPQPLPVCSRRRQFGLTSLGCQPRLTS